MPTLTRAERSDLDLVIFDNDGVLVDSERLTVGLEAELLTELGWPVTTADVVRRWMGRSPAQQHADVTAQLGPATADEFEARLTDRLWQRFESDLRSVDGVSDLLESLAAQGIRVCVASSGTPDGIRRKLVLTGLTAQFGERVFSATEVAHGKPAPDLFLHAAAGWASLHSGVW